MLSSSRFLWMGVSSWVLFAFLSALTKLFLSAEENHAGSLLTIQALSNDQIFKRVGVIQKI